MNLVKILVLVPLIISNLLVAGQQYGYCFLISKADSCLFAVKYHKALEFYKMAFNGYVDSVASRDVARSIRPALFVKDSMHIRSSAHLLLPKDFQLNADTYAEIDKINKDSLCYEVRGYHGWNQIIGFYSDSAIRKKARYNPSLRLTLEQIFDRDQRLRLVLDSIYRSGVAEVNQKIIDSLSIQVRINDSLNLVLVSDILGKYGWLGIEQVGEKANTALFSVIQHADLRPDMQKKYLPILEAAVKQGKARGQYLAMLKDRISLRESGSQMYGTQVAFNPVTGTVSPQPLISSTDVDMFRACVGLPPLRYYLTLFTNKK